jgi:hypothetical protein
MGGSSAGHPGFCAAPLEELQGVVAAASTNGLKSTCGRALCIDFRPLVDFRPSWISGPSRRDPAGPGARTDWSRVAFGPPRGRRFASIADLAAQERGTTSVGPATTWEPPEDAQAANVRVWLRGTAVSLDVTLMNPVPTLKEVDPIARSTLVTELLRGSGAASSGVALRRLIANDKGVKMSRQDTSSGPVEQRHAAEHADLEHRHVNDHAQVSREHLAQHEQLYNRHDIEHAELADRHAGEHEKAAAAAARRKAMIDSRHVAEHASLEIRHASQLAALAARHAFERLTMDGRHVVQLAALERRHVSEDRGHRHG